MASHSVFDHRLSRPSFTIVRSHSLRGKSPVRAGHSDHPMHIRQVALKLQLNVLRASTIILNILFELPRDQLGFTIVDSHMTALYLVAGVSLITPPQRAVTVHVKHT